MTKTTAIQIFGNRSELAKAVNRSPAWVSRLPEKLTEDQASLIVGAAYRLKKQLPKIGELL